MWVLILLAPPVLYGVLVEGVVKIGFRGDVGPAGLAGLFALAYALPVAALAWTVFSVAGYSIGGGRLIVHRVVRDEEYPLTQLQEPPQICAAGVRLRCAGRTVFVRVPDPETCAAELTRAAQWSRQSAQPR